MDESKRDELQRAQDSIHAVHRELARIFPSLSPDDIITPLVLAVFSGLNSMILSEPENLDLGVELAVTISQIIDHSNYAVLTPWSAFAKQTRQLAARDTNFLILRDFSRFDANAIDELIPLMKVLDDNRHADRPTSEMMDLPHLLQMTAVVDTSHDRGPSILRPIVDFFGVGIHL
jgi:hypothetical protein